VSAQISIAFWPFRRALGGGPCRRAWGALEEVCAVAGCAVAAKAANKRTVHNLNGRGRLRISSDGNTERAPDKRINGDLTVTSTEP